MELSVDMQLLELTKQLNLLMEIFGKMPALTGKNGARRKFVSKFKVKKN